MKALLAVALAVFVAGCASQGGNIGGPITKVAAAAPRPQVTAPPVKITPEAARTHVARRSVWERFWPKKSTTN